MSDSTKRPDADRVTAYSEAIHGEWWSGASDYSDRAVRAVIALADSERVDDKAEIAGLRRANKALRDHANDLSKIAAKCDQFALEAGVAERRAEAAEAKVAELEAEIEKTRDQRQAVIDHNRQLIRERREAMDRADAAWREGAIIGYRITVPPRMPFLVHPADVEIVRVGFEASDDLTCPSCGHYRDTPNHELGCREVSADGLH